MQDKVSSKRRVARLNTYVSGQAFSQTRGEGDVTTRISASDAARAQLQDAAPALDTRTGHEMDGSASVFVVTVAVGGGGATAGRGLRGPLALASANGHVASISKLAFPSLERDATDDLCVTSLDMHIT